MRVASRPLEPSGTKNRTCSFFHKHNVSMSKRTKSTLAEAIATKFLRGAEYGAGVVAGAATLGATGNEPLAAVAGYATEAMMHQADNWLFGLDATQQATQDMDEVYNPELTQHYSRMQSRKFYKARSNKRTVSRKKMVLYRAPRTEVKHWDISNSLAISAVQSMTIANLGPYPVQGTDSNARVGRRIKVISFLFKCVLQITAPGQVPLSGMSVSCSLVQDRETKSALSSVNDIYDTAVSAVPNFITPLKLDNKRRFNVLAKSVHDVVVTSSAAGVTTATNNHQEIRHFVKKHMEVNFVAVSGTVSDIVDNSLNVVACPSVASVAATPGNLVYTCRFFYTDI